MSNIPLANGTDRVRNCPSPEGLEIYWFSVAQEDIMTLRPKKLLHNMRLYCHTWNIGKMTLQSKQQTITQHQYLDFQSVLQSIYLKDIPNKTRTNNKRNAE